MRSPLALIKRQDDTWTVVKTSDAARGIRAKEIVTVREPTEEEKGILHWGLVDGGKMTSLDGLLEKAWMYDDLCD